MKVGHFFAESLLSNILCTSGAETQYEAGRTCEGIGLLTKKGLGTAVISQISR